MIEGKDKKLKKIIIIAFVVRLFALTLITFSGDWESSFLGNYNLSDDYKYEMGATIFAKNAKNLLDVDAFTKAFNSVDSTDWTGLHLNQPITYATFWYMIVCFLVYYTKTKYSIRLFNIFLALLSIKQIYGFSSRVYGEKTATLAVKLYAFLPYPVIFCCFGYKEEMAMFCTFYLLNKAVKQRYGEKLQAKEVIGFIFAAVMLMGIRSGISIMLFGICLFLMFFKGKMDIKRLSLKQTLLLLASILMTFVLIVLLRERISHKMEAYLGPQNNRTAGSMISLLMINKITDIWKIPFAYLFSILQPFGVKTGIHTWSDVVAAVNFCMSPIAIGATIYMLFKKKPDLSVYWLCQLYYFIYLITSLNIFRHYASLLPLPLIGFSAYASKLTQNRLTILFVGSIILSLAITVFNIGLL